MSAAPLSDLLRGRPDLIADVSDWRRRLYDRPLQINAAAAVIGYGVLDVLDVVERTQALGAAMLTLSSLRDACCRFAASASEVLAAVVETTEGDRALIAAEYLPSMLEHDPGPRIAAFMEAAAAGEFSLDVYGRILRDRAKAVLHSLRYLVDITDLSHDIGQTREREIVELIALALVLPIALPAPSLVG